MTGDPGRVPPARRSLYLRARDRHRGPRLGIPASGSAGLGDTRESGWNRARPAKPDALTELTRCVPSGRCIRHAGQPACIIKQPGPPRISSHVTLATMSACLQTFGGERAAESASRFGQLADAPQIRPHYQVRVEIDVRCCRLTRMAPDSCSRCRQSGDHLSVVSD